MNKGKDIQALHDTLDGFFSIGAAITPSQISGSHADLLKKHFNCIVAENCMKPEEIQPVEGQYNWEEADRVIAFAKDNHMKIRFHTLVWHNQTAAWFFKDKDGNEMTATPENKKLLLDRLDNHIRAVVGRYKEDVDSWDVVNEVIDPEESNGHRRSKWYEITGIEFIEKAFRITREVAGKDAKLYINDFNTNKPDKREAFYNVVKELLVKDVPIDGVGHQMHINIDWPTASVIRDTIDLFSELGLDNQVTELDVSVYSNSTDKYETIPDENLVKQGYKYKEIFEVFKEKQQNISAVVTWGIADDHTWLKTFPITRRNLPLIFDEQLKPKYAYWGIVDPSQLPKDENNRVEPMEW
ncbi:GH35 family endo-1,4-beta-xylanase [Virgibacillus natechei]|uniref:Beta-xylanase n=1 Tax=Virgibacillus natechei TaxID=1216297 RepID=A0ABS4IEH2_9BACI|nr:endo-1,4-beta-xylanase [Virgibacillus natechei]MBP1969329.1 GH35 family endo-1,4-beta-xylanase [Virgibacillus natechei]UZD12481.1 endo-1,4-beta-xylanase [Virgibacillus natechei]